MIEQQIQLLQFIVLLAKKSVKVLVFIKQDPSSRANPFAWCY
jgi:hypothetical protein